LLINVLICFSGCEKKNHDAVYKDAGVVIRGYNTAGGIENTNDFLIRMEMLCWRAGYHPMKIITLKPKEKLCVYIDRHYAFRIYDEFGILIGFIQIRDMEGK